MSLQHQEQHREQQHLQQQQQHREQQHLQQQQQTTYNLALGDFKMEGLLLFSI